MGYSNGDEVEDGIRHLKLAAMGGHEQARHKLGELEISVGNTNRAMRHFMISACAGFDESLAEIRNGFMNGHVVTKAEFERILRAHKNSQDEMKSEQRTRASARLIE